MVHQPGSHGKASTTPGGAFHPLRAASFETTSPFKIIDALDLREKLSIDALDLGGKKRAERRMPPRITPYKNAHFYAQCMLDERTPKKNNALDNLTNAFTYVPEPYLEFLAMQGTRYFFDSDDKKSPLHSMQPGGPAPHGMHLWPENEIHIKFSNMETGTLLHETAHAIDRTTRKNPKTKKSFKGFLKKLKRLFSGQKTSSSSDSLESIRKKHPWFKGAYANSNTIEWFAESWRLHLGVPLFSSLIDYKDDPRQETPDNIRTYWSEKNHQSLAAIDKIFNRLEKDIKSYLESQKERPWKYEIGKEVPKQELRERQQQQIESRAAALSNQKEISAPLHDPRTTKRGPGFDKAVGTIKPASVQGKSAKERTKLQSRV